MNNRVKTRYTLIELLVVLSIIGVLMSLLMTALVRVDDQVEFDFEEILQCQSSTIVSQNIVEIKQRISKDNYLKKADHILAS